MNPLNHSFLRVPKPSYPKDSTLLQSLYFHPSKWYGPQAKPQHGEHVWLVLMVASITT